jgi:hypothetical protein
MYRQTLECLGQTKRTARRCKNNLDFQIESHIILLQLQKLWKANSQKYPRRLKCNGTVSSVRYLRSC